MINDLGKDIGRIEQVSMADVVELRLRNYFKKMSLKPGDPLPKELDLAGAMGVSRSVVREALSRLKMLGMVQSRKKTGLVMSSPDILSAFERVLDPMIITTDALQDLFELRLVLEMGLADILFINITDKSLSELERIANAEGSSDQEFRVMNEIEFHSKLYEIAGNDTLKRFQKILMPVFSYVIQMETELIDPKVSHKGLVQLLKDGNKDNFRQGMYAHLKPHFDRLEAKKNNFSFLCTT